jgi:predicted kinase
VSFIILDLQATEAQMRERVAKRARAQTDASEADPGVLEQQLAAREPLDDEERTCAIAVSSDQPNSAIIALLAKFGKTAS